MQLFSSSSFMSCSLYVISPVEVVPLCQWSLSHSQQTGMSLLLFFRSSSSITMSWGRCCPKDVTSVLLLLWRYIKTYCVVVWFITRKLEDTVLALFHYYSMIMNGCLSKPPKNLMFTSPLTSRFWICMTIRSPHYQQTLGSLRPCR